MSATTSDLYKAAMTLSDKQRSKLVERLVKTLPVPFAGPDDAELVRRLDSAGDVKKLKTWEQVKADLKRPRQRLVCRIFV